jgi:hypothetical protein
MTSSTIPSYGYSNMAMCDLSSAFIFSWFGILPLTLGASLGILEHQGFPISWVSWLYPTFDILIYITTRVVYWVSSTTGVGLHGAISTDKISSKLTNFGGRGGFCSLLCGCCGSLRLLQGHLYPYLGAPNLGHAMVVQVFSIDLSWLCNFCKLVLSLVYFVSIYFSQFHYNPYDSRVITLYRNRVKLLEEIIELAF